MLRACPYLLSLSQASKELSAALCAIIKALLFVHTTEGLLPLAFTLTGADADGDALSFVVTTGPEHGQLSGVAPELTYAPNTGFYGVDTIVFQVNDSQANSLPATVTITVVAPAYRLPDTGQEEANTETYGTDSDYTINPPDYTDNGDGTVTDKLTGFMWQQQGDKIARTWENTQAYLHAFSLAGYDDWRLPTKKELMSIVDFG